MEKLDISYFKKKKGFHPLFLEFKKKYSSYGRLGGIIKLDNPSDETKEALSGILGVDVRRDKEVKVSVVKFEKALLKTIFKDFTLIEIVEAYFGEELRSKKEIQAEKEEQKRVYFQTYYKYAKNDLARYWLEAIIEKNELTKYVHNYYERDKKALSSILNNVIHGLNRLPLKEYERLPIFAAITTKNPHYFDIGTDSGRVLLAALQLYLKVTEGKYFTQSPNSGEITEILARFNIMRDDINNDVTVFGLQGYYQDGSTSNLLKFAMEENVVMNLPLREVVRLGKISALNNKVYVIENSGLYSTLIDKIIEQEVEVSMVCSSGQFNLATWKLIDKLVDNNHYIYYSGDFDPEGILMANKIKEKYPNYVHYWHLDVASYKSCLSDEIIVESRLNQLLNIQNQEIGPLITSLLNTKRSGYQERLMESLLEEIKSGKI
ncbi:TIGR02679 family protein [Metabacillus lacus]|uniref:TIGR02679 family protein n=1 Tax=Metabacillus lacus TaxID=1983721 RepID=UPI0014787E8C